MSTLGYNNGLIVGTVIGKEISKRSDDYWPGSHIDKRYLQWGSSKSLYYKDPTYISTNPSDFFVDDLGYIYILRTLYDNGVYNATVTKYDSNNNLIFVLNLGSNVRIVTMDSSYNIYCVYGTYDSTTQVWSSDIVKYDRNSSYQWSLTSLHGPEWYGLISAITTDTYDNVYFSWSITSDGTTDTKIFKMDKNGAIPLDSFGHLAYFYIYQAVYPNRAYNLATDALGNLYAAYMGKVKTVDEYGNNAYNAILIKVDKYKNLIWATAVASIGITSQYDSGLIIWEIPEQLITDSLGNIFLSSLTTVGSFYEIGTVSKYNSAGQRIWSNFIYASDQINSIAVDCYGQCIMISNHYTDIDHNYFVVLAHLLAANDNSLQLGGPSPELYSDIQPFATTATSDVHGNLYIGYQYVSSATGAVQPIQTWNVQKLPPCNHFTITGPPLNPNFLMYLQTYNDDAPKQQFTFINGMNTSYPVSSSDYGNVNARINAKLVVSGTWPDMSYYFGWYDPTNPTYSLTNGIQMYRNSRNVIILEVIAQARENSSDLVACTLDVENNTIYPIEIDVVLDDPVNPRFVLGTVTGTNTNVTVV